MLFRHYRIIENNCRLFPAGTSGTITPAATILKSTGISGNQAATSEKEQQKQRANEPVVNTIAPSNVIPLSSSHSSFIRHESPVFLHYVAYNVLWIRQNTYIHTYLGRDATIFMERKIWNKISDEINRSNRAVFNLHFLMCQDIFILLYKIMRDVVGQYTTEYDIRVYNKSILRIKIIKLSIIVAVAAIVTCHTSGKYL